MGAVLPQTTLNPPEADRVKEVSEMARGSQKLEKSDGPDSEKWVSCCAVGLCVEVLREGEIVRLRESSNRNMEVRIPSPSWDVFVDGVKAGKFDGIGG